MPSCTSSSVVDQDNNNHLQSNLFSNDIFGYRGYVCKQCLCIEIHYLYFLDEHLERDRKNVNNHLCDSNKLAQSQLDIYKNIHFNENYRTLLPLYLKQNINEWTKGQNYLSTIQLSNPPENIIKLNHPKNPDKSITLHYYQKNNIELTNIEDKDNWISRAIKNTQTSLSDNDLTEFLHIVKDRTFAVFKIQKQKSVSFYLMVITNIPLSNN
jgi:hypothetical protein